MTGERARIEDKPLVVWEIAANGGCQLRVCAQFALEPMRSRREPSAAATSFPDRAAILPRCITSSVRLPFLALALLTIPRPITQVLGWALGLSVPYHPAAPSTSPDTVAGHSGEMHRLLRRQPENRQKRTPERPSCTVG